MWGHEKLKEWVREHFAIKGDVVFREQQYWELWRQVQDLYQYLGLERQVCPGKVIVKKKGGKGCQQ